MKESSKTLLLILGMLFWIITFAFLGVKSISLDQAQTNSIPSLIPDVPDTPFNIKE